jgi:adenine-specific DNA-methyltransferase
VQFYRHDIDWTNRLILGDSLQVMASLARREDLAGKVQMIYMDPPYGIKFASNFQPEIGNRDVKDKETDLTREIEMVKAYRDTWTLGMHSYLSYLRDRLLVARALLADTGSIFMQMGDENLHTVRQLLDEVFGVQNCCSVISVWKTSSATSSLLATTCDYLLWYAKSLDKIKYRQQYIEKDAKDPSTGAAEYKFVMLPNGLRKPLTACSEEEVAAGEFFRPSPTTSQSGSQSTRMPVALEGKTFTPGPGGWKTNARGFERLTLAGRLMPRDKSISYIRYLNDFSVVPVSNLWTDARWGFDASEKRYVVETNPKVIARCMLMTTDPGDLVLDPTCGSGTTAYVAEQWGRRWITMDTSRVAVAIARQRLLTAKYEYYQLRSVTTDDQAKNPNGTWLTDPQEKVKGLCTFLCQKVPHITLKSIAQNANLDPIFAKHEPILEAKLAACNAALAKVTPDLRSRLELKRIDKERAEGKRAVTDADRQRWVLPPENRDRSAEARKKSTVDLDNPFWYHWEVPFDADSDWPNELAQAVTAYRKAWRAKMDEINACIAANADSEELVDKPDPVKGVVRVSGPFTVEAVQPPEMSLGDVVGHVGLFGGEPGELPKTFAVRPVERRNELEVQNVEAYLDQMVNLLRIDGVRFPDNKQRDFTRLERIVGSEAGVQAEGRWVNKGEADADPEGRATVAVAFGPQYGPVTAKQVEELIRASSRRGYDDLVVAGFSFDGPAQATIHEAQHPQLRIHMAHVRPDVNPGMNGLLKEKAGSQLFSVFGQPRTLLNGPDGQGEYTVVMEGVDIYDPVANTVRSTDQQKVAAWFIDGDYDGRCFCITQAFFPDKAAWEKLSKALGGVVDPARFEALAGTESLPFPAGKHKCVAVKVIDPRGNEVMQVHRLG